MSENSVVTRFNRRLDASIDYHRELILAIHGKRRESSLESMLVEQFVLYVAVLWELFINDLILTYLTTSPDTYLETLEERIAQSLEGRFGSAVAKCNTFEAPTTPSRDRIAALVDPRGFNVGAQNAAILAKRANELLAAPYAKKFVLAQDDAQFIDFLIALRNFLGHRSKGSRQSLKDAINELHGANADLRSQFRDIAVYLKSRVGADSRAVVIARRLIAVATGLG